MLDPMKGAGKQLDQRGSLIGVESLENLVLDGVHCAAGPTQRLAAGVSYLHAVTAAVLGVATTHDVAGVLELVEQQDDVLGIHAERVDELLLRDAVVISHVAEGHEQAQIHPEQVGTDPPHHLLGQTR